MVQMVKVGRDEGLPLDSASVDCFDLEDGRQSSYP